MSHNTLFLRLEGALQAWGDNQSKFFIRRTNDAPTKSGVIGLLLCATGVGRAEAREHLTAFNDLRMGVRIDRPGVRWWDYHTVGAGTQMPIAKAAGETKPGAMLTRREYLCDASFLVALQGDATLLEDALAALRRPKWALYLGRKSCVASVPIVGRIDQPDTGDFADLAAALRSVPWRGRFKEDEQRRPAALDALIEWRPTPADPHVPADAELWYDHAIAFDTPGHTPRVVVRQQLAFAQDVPTGERTQSLTAAPSRPQADYQNAKYKNHKADRMNADAGLCVFCKSRGEQCHHVSYARAGGNEAQADLRTLCRLCHDACTLLEYGMNMGTDRVDPLDPAYRDRIITKRREIIQFRSRQTQARRRKYVEVD